MDAFDLQILIAAASSRTCAMDLREDMPRLPMCAWSAEIASRLWRHDAQSVGEPGLAAQLAHSTNSSAFAENARSMGWPGLVG